MIGEQIEHYRIDAIQDQGALGTVYRAYDTNLIRPVALKLIFPKFVADSKFRDHIMNEAKAAAKLIHPNIATIYNFTQKGNSLYLISEFVLGHSLNQLLAKLTIMERSLRLADALMLGAEIADALAYAHQQGVLHRNLKPSNIMLKPLDATPKRDDQLPIRPLVTDFGLTKHLSGDVKSNPEDLGPGLNYISPEHAIGNRLDGRSDIYVLGLILYELIAGQRPFQIYAPTEAMIMHALESPPPLTQLIPSIPQDVSAVIAKAIAKQPEKRIQDMQQFAEQLRRAAKQVQPIQQENDISMADLLETELTIDAANGQTKPNSIVGLSLNQLPVPENELASILQEALESENSANEAVSSDHAETDQVEILPSHTPPVLQNDQNDAPPAQIMPQLDHVVVQRPGYSPVMIQLDKDLLNIGRSRDNDIVLETSDVSRRHAQLEKTSAGWRIVDLNSTGGTYWGGHKLLPNIPEAWNTNQALRIGPYALRWLPARAPRPFRTDDLAQDERTKLHVVPTEGTQISSTKGNFSLMVTPVLIELNPGSAGVVQVELFNQGVEADHFSLRVVDLPPTISSLSQNAVYLTPGERATLPITLTIPDDNPISAGHHPFQIVVRREGDSTDTAVISSRLTVGSSEKFSLGVWPLDIPQNGICQILIRNEGNTNGRFSLTGASSDPNLTFLGERGQIRVDSGQATTLSMTVATGKRPMFGRKQHVPFNIKVRSEAGHEQTETGRLEVTPRLPAWILPVIEMFIVILFAGVAFSSYFSNSGDDTSNIAIAQEQEGDFAFEFGDEHGVLPVGEFTPRPTIIPATATAELLDEDNDGLTTADEFSFATDPNNPDTDGDGLLDGEEVGLYDTIPTAADSDLDGLLDGEEVNQYKTNPLFSDTDLDGVLDGQEVAEGTDPLRFPTDSTENDEVVEEIPREDEPFIPEDDPTPFATAIPTQIAVPTEAPIGQPTAVAQPTEEPIVQPTNTPLPTAVPVEPPANGASTIQLALIDSGTGWVSINGQVSEGMGNLIRVGDTDQGDTVRGFFTYDLSQIPLNANITSARLTFSANALVEGAPFDTLDCLLIEAAEFELPLDATDFDTFAFYIDCEAGPPNVINVLIDVQDAVDFQLDYLQFRLSFSDETNFDTQADQIVIQNAPILEVTFDQ
ncbi:MAG: protein kinase [Chloroflexota bacterium]